MARELYGSIAKNAKKEVGTKQPDYRGSAMIEGTEYWIAGWIRTDDDGKTYLSLKFEVKEDRPDRREERPTPSRKPITDDDSIPF